MLLQVAISEQGHINQQLLIFVCEVAIFALLFFFGRFFHDLLLLLAGLQLLALGD
jgi:hypothetical protein